MKGYENVRCRKCGGPVEILMWVNAETGEVDWREPAFDLYEDPRTSGIQAVYCEYCRDDHGVYERDDVGVQEAVRSMFGVLQELARISA